MTVVMTCPSRWIISILTFDSWIVTPAGVVRMLTQFGSYRGVGSSWKIVWRVSNDSVASFFVISVEGVVVGEGCDSNEYEIVLVDDVDSSIRNSDNYVGGE
jgi:hypothetical protein